MKYKTEKRTIILDHLPPNTYFKLVELKAKMHCASWIEFATKLAEIGIRE